jgi:hypothetical protein
MRAGMHCLGNKPTLRLVMGAGVRRLSLGKVFTRGTQYHHRNHPSTWDEIKAMLTFL